MPHIDAVFIQCPSCGEEIEIVVDGSVEHQQYIEDCSVCCRPIILTVSVEAGEDVHVDARAEGD